MQNGYFVFLQETHIQNNCFYPLPQARIVVNIRKSVKRILCEPFNSSLRAKNDGNVVEPTAFRQFAVLWQFLSTFTAVLYKEVLILRLIMCSRRIFCHEIFLPPYVLTAYAGQNTAAYAVQEVFDHEKYCRKRTHRCTFIALFSAHDLPCECPSD